MQLQAYNTTSAMIEYPSPVERTWKRNLSVAPFPNIWSRFIARSRDNRSLKIRIQDMTPDQRNEVWRIHKKHLFQDNEIPKSANVIEDETSLKSLAWLFDQRARANLSIVAVLDTEDPRPVIVGGLKLQVISKEDPQNPTLPGEALAKIHTLHGKVRGDLDVFRKLKINRYFEGAGFVVKPEYRRLGIGIELLKTVERMAKTFHIPAAVVSLGNIRSQSLAAKLGYSVLGEVKLSEYVDESGRMILPVAHAEKCVIQLRYKFL